jgi:Rho-binding antiterminator
MNSPAPRQSTDYRPIDCEFHDVLEAAATTRKVVDVVFHDHATGELTSRSARIVDLFSRSGEEFMTLDTGDTMRLDRIVSVDQVMPTDPP